MNNTFEVNLNTNNTDDKLDEILTEEIKSKLIEKFPKKTNEIFKITQIELNILKGLVESNNQEEIEELIRENLITDDIDGKETSEIKEEKQATLETITIGVKSKQIENIKIVIASSISEKLNTYTFITNQQKNNIMLGITAKILKSGVLMSAFSGIGDLTNNFITKIQSGDFSEAIGQGKNQVEKIGELKNILNNNLSELLTIIEKNKTTPDKLDILLSNPLAIEKLNTDTKIENIENINTADLSTYLLGINKTILEYDTKILGFEGMSTSIVTAISKSPELLQKASKSLLELLLKIPFIGGILASLMGYKTADLAIEGFGKELKYAKSTNNLISHGGTVNDNNIFESSTNESEISILKDKDLSLLKYKKLKPFYETCKKESIDYTTDDFWNKLFNGKIDKTKEPKFYDLHTKFKKNKIDNSDFDNKEPKNSFYDKLNNLDKVNTPIPRTNNVNTLGTEELKKKKTKISKKILNESNLTEVDDNTDFSKLGNSFLDSDLDDLKEDISLADLLSDDYKSLIQSQVGVDLSWISEEWNDKINYDYNSIKEQIENIRNKLSTLGKEKIEKIAGKKAVKITFGELIDTNGKIYKKLYKSELEEIKEIDSLLGKKKELKAIKESLNIISGDIIKIEYKVGNEKTSVKFDKDKQEISINEEIHKISIKMNYSLTSMTKVGDNISMNASISGILEQSFDMSIDKFSNFIYELKNNGSIDLENNDGEKVGKISKI